jgi:catechol 2,3-dioxygenase-like lactoylglutathione lyase family enzyme
MMNLYDGGLLSRRDLMRGLLLLAAPAAGLAQSKASTPVVVGHTVNHVQIMVRDLAASADFYEKLVGAKKEPRSNPDTWAMVMPGTPTSVLTLQRSPDRSGVLDHFGIGIRNFKVQDVEAAVKQAVPGVDLQIASGTVPAVGIRDPDGILVQLNPAG